jgi:YHS domain-containing protein
MVGEDGKRYCFGSEAAKTEFLKDPKGHLENARAFRGGGGAP